MSVVRTCADCPAEVTGKAERCPACSVARRKKKNLVDAARLRARKKKGLPAISPDRGAGSLGTYEQAKQAIAAARTTDDAKSIRNKSDALRVYAERARDPQLVTDAIEIRTRAERRLGEIIKQQKETVGLNTGAKGIGKSAVPKEDRTPTLADAGISKNLSSEAQKLADIPEDEFEQRIDTWRDDIEDGKLKPSVNPLSAKPKQPRKENDFYPTPHSIIDEICARWQPDAGHIWEPCGGDGRLAAALVKAGHDVHMTDLATGTDFFEKKNLPVLKRQMCWTICTNPPFDRAREFLEHAFALDANEMCLVLPERFWASDIGRKQFEKYRPRVWANLDWREDYLGKGGSPDRALGVAIWDGACAERCDFQVWSRENGRAGK